MKTSLGDLTATWTLEHPGIVVVSEVADSQGVHRLSGRQTLNTVPRAEWVELWREIQHAAADILAAPGFADSKDQLPL
ncbi:hypothetical protein [Nocardia nova]|jgi:hypothetical protein|uniref:hypothetical protein n=1 Tax=Nocardia nova TaxID=37330 RepID=UPI0027385B78|nr:hypothetical protein [Nocardia nova]